jgi:phosphonoacetaldehyde hydrolase
MMDEFAGRRSYRGPLRALVLDWAGTCVDYGSRAPAAVFVEVFAQRGVKITVEEARGPMGRAKHAHIRAIGEMPRVAAEWKAVHGRAFEPTDVDELYADFLPRQLRCINRYSDVIPGVVETIDACRKRGLKIGSSTGYTTEIMDVVMARAREQGFAPDAMLCASDISEGRPAPWLIFENAQRLGVYPMAAIVKIDDTVAGIEAGLNAGTWAIGIAKTGNEVGLSEDELNDRPEAERTALVEGARARLRQARAHYVVDGVADILPVLDEIEQRLARGQTPL